MSSGALSQEPKFDSRAPKVLSTEPVFFFFLFREIDLRSDERTRFARLEKKKLTEIGSRTNGFVLLNDDPRREDICGGLFVAFVRVRGKTIGDESSPRRGKRSLPVGDRRPKTISGFFARSRRPAGSIERIQKRLFVVARLSRRQLREHKRSPRYCVCEEKGWP